jgi:cytochrome c-type biogenesis protein CcmH/NrfF
MPVCEDCTKHFVETELDVAQRDIENLYRAVADGEPKLEILHLMYSMFGEQYQLAPPSTELRTSQRLSVGRSGVRG